MEMFKDSIDENQGRDSQLQKDTRPPPFILKAREAIEEFQIQEAVKEKNQAAQKSVEKKKEEEKKINEDGKAAYESEKEKKKIKKVYVPQMKESVTYKNEKIEKQKKQKILKPLYESEGHIEIQN